MGAQRYDFPSEEFFGIGADSRPEDDVTYGLKNLVVSGGGGVRPHPLLSVAGRIEWMTPRISGGREDRSIQEVFDDQSAPGLERQPKFALGRPLHMGAYGVDELLGDHTLLTNLRYAAGDDLGVQTMISDALAIFPEDPVATAYARGGTPVANAAAGVEAIFARGVELTNQSRHLEAAVAYRLAVRISEQPDGQGWAKAADAWNNLGFSLAAAGLFQEAVPALGRALALRPGFELAANNLAWAQGEVAASY